MFVSWTNVLFLIYFSGEQLYGIVEDLRDEKSPDATTKLEKALSTLISDVQTLHEEYKTLENTFRK